jgi:ABC-2 type transport system permease protein
MRNSLTSVKPVPDMLSPGSAFGLMCAYAAVALAAGAWVLTHRDA